MYFEFDRGNLSHLTPQKIKMYLIDSGWGIIFKKPEFIVYGREEVKSQIIIPRSMEYSDYASKVNEMLSLISRVKNHSIHDVYADISLVNSADSIQYKIDDRSKDGTISLMMMRNIITVSKSVSAAAYMDIVSPSSYHESCNKGHAALRDMRVGQSSYGSYVMRFIYPFNTDMQTTLQGGSIAYESHPLKHIAAKIIESSRTVVQAAEENIMKIKDDTISYNFTDSLMGFQFDDTRIEMKKLKFSPDSDYSGDVVEFEEQIFPRIANIVEELRPKELDERRNFNGWLSKMDKEAVDEDDIKFTLNCRDDTGEFSVSITLSGIDRDEALRSITENKYVKLSGKIKGYSQRKIIEEIEDFKVIE